MVTAKSPLSSSASCTLRELALARAGRPGRPRTRPLNRARRRRPAAMRAWPSRSSAMLVSAMSSSICGASGRPLRQPVRQDQRVVAEPAGTGAGRQPVDRGSVGPVASRSATVGRSLPGANAQCAVPGIGSILMPRCGSSSQVLHPVRDRRRRSGCRYTLSAGGSKNASFSSGLTRRSIGRRHHPDRHALAAAGVEVAGVLQRQRRVGGVQRADVHVVAAPGRPDEDLPERAWVSWVRRAHGRLAAGSCRGPCSLAWRRTRRRPRAPRRRRRAACRRARSAAGCTGRCP